MRKAGLDAWAVPRMLVTLVSGNQTCKTVAPACSAAPPRFGSALQLAPCACRQAGKNASEACGQVPPHQNSLAPRTSSTCIQNAPARSPLMVAPRLGVCVARHPSILPPKLLQIVIPAGGLMDLSGGRASGKQPTGAAMTEHCCQPPLHLGGQTKLSICAN